MKKVMERAFNKIKEKNTSIDFGKIQDGTTFIFKNELMTKKNEKSAYSEEDGREILFDSKEKILVTPEVSKERPPNYDARRKKLNDPLFKIYKNTNKDDLLIDLLRDKEGLPTKYKFKEVREAFEKWGSKGSNETE